MERARPTRSLWLGLALACLLATPASALSIPVNGSFEDGARMGSFKSLSGGSTAIDGWVVLDAGVDYIGSYWTASDGSRSVDLAKGAPGGIAQDIATLAGHTYVVTFDMAGNPDGPQGEKLMEVSAAGASALYSFDTTGHSRTDMGWVTREFSFVATGTTTTLSFRSAGPQSAYGPALDNVSITAMPEPSTALLFGLGVTGLAAAGRRRRA